MPDNEDLPDWDAIKSDDDFISLSANDQLAVLDNWEAHVGGKLKEAGAAPQNLEDLGAYVGDNRSEIQHSSDTRRAIRDLSEQGAFTGATPTDTFQLFPGAPLTGHLSPEDQGALSAPFMGEQILAAMGIPDVWGKQKELQQADRFKGLGVDGKSMLAEGDPNYRPPITDPKELKELRAFRWGQMKAAAATGDGEAQDLLNAFELPGKAAMATAGEMVGQYGWFAAGPDAPVDNKVGAGKSAASAAMGTWAKASLDSLPVRATAKVFDLIYGDQAGFETSRKKQSGDIGAALEGVTPEGYAGPMVNPALRHDPVEQLSRGLGHMMDWKTPLMFAGTPGFISFGLASAEQSYDQAATQTLDTGGSTSDARWSGLAAAAWTLPTLAIYMGMGKMAQEAAAELLPIAATPLARATVSLPLNVAANMAGSGTLRVMQGGEFMGPDWIENAVPDVLFALHSATSGYKEGAKVERLTPTMSAVAAGTHPDIILRKLVADSPAFPDEVRKVASNEVEAQQLAARQFLENAGKPVPADESLPATPEATEAQAKMVELAAERTQIMRRLNDPENAPQPGDVARLQEMQGEMEGLIKQAMSKETAAPAPAPEAAAPAQAAAPEEPAPEEPAPLPRPKPAPPAEPPPAPPEVQRATLDAKADVEHARNAGDPVEIAAAEAALTAARSATPDKPASTDIEAERTRLEDRAREMDLPPEVEKLVSSATTPEQMQQAATQVEEAVRLSPRGVSEERVERGDEPVAAEVGIGPAEIQDFYFGTNETGINPNKFGQDGLTMEIARRRKEGNKTAPAPEKPAGAPAAPPEPASRPSVRKGFKLPYAPLGAPDLVDFVVEQGGIKLPKKGDRKQEHDDAPTLPGVYRRLATTGGKISADEMAQMLYEAHLIRDAHVPTMWAELGKAVESRTRIREQEANRVKQERTAEREAAKQEKAFDKAAKDPEGGKRVDVESLAVGDEVEVGGEKLKVREIDPDTNDVTLEDGKKYGMQIVRDGEVIYGEHTPAERGGDFLPAGEDSFVLDTVTKKQLEAEQEQQRQREALREGVARRLEGGAGDLTADMFGEGDTALFNQRRDVPAEAPPTPPVETAPAAEVAAGLSGEQHLKLDATVRASADGFTWRSEAEKDSAIAQVLTKVEAQALKWQNGIGSLDGFSAAVLARSRFTDIVRKAEAKLTEAEAPREEGWTETTRDIPDRDMLTPEQQAARSEVASKVVSAFDKFTDKGAKAADKEAVVKLAQEGTDSPTEIAKAMGWFTGKGESRRPDASKAIRVLRAAGEDILRETKLTREEVLGIMPPHMAEMISDVTAGISYARGLLARISSPGDWTDFRKTLLTWSMRQQRSATEIQNMVRESLRIVPNVRRREAITNWLEARGDNAVLTQRAADSINLRVREGYEIAQRLTPEEIAYARKVRATYDTLLGRGQSYGVIRTGVPDYVNHVWRRPNEFFRAAESRRLSTYLRNAQHRTFASYFEGEQQGFRAETKDIAKLLGVYLNDLNQSIISRRFVLELADGKAKDGRPLLAPEGAVKTVQGNNGEWVYLVYPKRLPAASRDYVRTETQQPALEQWLWHAADEAGNPILVRDSLLIHPDHAKQMNNVFGRNAFRQWFNSGEQGSLEGLTKRALGFLIFDVQSVAKQTMLGFLSPFHAVQEGTHAIGHRINPFFGLPRIDLTSSVEQRDAAAHGLMLAPDRMSQDQFMEGIGGNSRNLATILVRRAGELFSRAGERLPAALGGRAVALGGRAVERLAQFTDDFQHWLFHQYIPSLKYKTYTAMVQRNSHVYQRELASGEISHDLVKYLSSTQANAAYGHLNYADLGRNQSFQSILQVALLAPDFLEARGKFVGQALKPSKAGREQILAIGFLGATLWTSARILNKIADDDWHWDEGFDVIGRELTTLGKVALAKVGADSAKADEIWNGTGSQKRRYRIRSVPEDLYAAFHDPRKFINGRMSPLIGKGVFQGITGVNYRGEQVDFTDTLKEIAASTIPLTLQPFTRGLSKTGRTNPVSEWEQLIGSLGIHVSRYSPLPELYKLAADWKKAETGEDAMRVVYPESKYAKLRYALEDADIERAGREWDALLAKDERASAKVSEAFRNSMKKPITGSQATDAKFVQTLKGKDLDTYQRALDRRQHILRQFGEMLTEKEKAATP